MKRLEEIFDIQYGSQLDLNKCILCEKPEGYNFVNRSEKNCGVSARILREENKKPFPAGLITVAMGGSVLSSFVQQEPFYTGQNVKILKPKKDMPDIIKLYYCHCIETNRFRFSTFGREANYSFDSMLVPSINEIPKELNKISISDYEFEKGAVLNKKLELKIDSWKWFDLKNIFEMERGERLVKTDREKGSMPLITAGFKNEGVAEYISNENMKRYKNAITIDMFNNCFYREYMFYCDDNILVLSNNKLNKYSGLFIVTILDNESYKFQYGRQYRQKNFKKHKIKLPVTDKNTPDWQFMEDYIKTLPYSKGL